MKQAIIRMEETVNCEKRGYILNDWKNIQTLDELPWEYMDGFPKFYILGDTLVLSIKTTHRAEFKVGTFVTLRDWDLYLTAFKKAGERLHKISSKPKIVEFKI